MKINDERVAAFIQYVNESCPPEVARAFAVELARETDPAEANLTLVLQRARESTPRERAREQAVAQSLLYYCNS